MLLLGALSACDLTKFNKESLRKDENSASMNHVPTGSSQSVNIFYNSSTTITLNATDADHDVLSFSVVKEPVHGTLSGTAPDLVYIPAHNYKASDSFIYKANDGVSDSDEFLVSINYVNQAPEAMEDSIVSEEDASIEISLLASDPDNDLLSYTIMSGPTHGELTFLNDSTLTYTPVGDYHGTDSFTYRVDDGTADSNTATVNITVNPLNDAPVATAQAVITNEDVAKAITLGATDLDGDPLTYVIVRPPDHGRVDVVSGAAVTYVPNANDNGSDSFDFKANDGALDSNTVTVSITLNPVSDLLLTANDHALTISNLTISDPTHTLNMKFARERHASVRLADGRIFVIGGLMSGVVLNSAEIFDPTANQGAGAWSVAPSMVTARSYPTATLLSDGRVLIVGGTNSSNVPSNAVEIFNPEANSGAGAWTTGPSLTTARVVHTAELLTDGRVLVVGGLGAGSTYLNSAEIFSPAANAGVGAWTNAPSFTTGRIDHKSGRLADGRVLICGGTASGNTRLTSTQIFSPTANAGAGAWTAGPNLATARYTHTVTRLADGRLLVAAGADSSGSLQSSELFDPAGNSGLGTWTSGPTLISARSRHTASALADGRVLVTGGGMTANNAEIFDPAGNNNAGTFSSAPSMSSSRVEHTANLLTDGRILVAGGQANSTAEIFDPTANTGAGGWTRSPRAVRYSHTSTLLQDGRVLIVGGAGNNSAFLSSVEIFNPAANFGAGEWTPGPSLATARFEHSATLLTDGRVLVAGGQSSGGFTTSVEIFNPAANGGAGEWTAGPSLIEGRSQQTESLLPNGRVLVAGGYSGGAALTSVEIFNPAANNGAGEWTSAPSLGSQRTQHTATVLRDGRVLVAGGTMFFVTFNTTEIFDPAAAGGAGSWTAGPALSRAKKSHRATQLPDGRILFSGGSSGFGGPHTACDIYDPNGNNGQGSISAGPTLSTARSGHSVNLLWDGRVLITGGSGASGTLASGELFDPAANSGAGAWSQAPTLQTARTSHSATLMQNGEILIQGGYSSTGGAESETATVSALAHTQIVATGAIGNPTIRIKSGNGTLVAGNSSSEALFVVGPAGTTEIEVTDGDGATAAVSIVVSE